MLWHGALPPNFSLSENVIVLKKCSCKDFFPLKFGAENAHRVEFMAQFKL